jgi:hypothetical protein
MALAALLLTQTAMLHHVSESSEEHNTVEKLLNKMTLVERISQLSSTAPAIDRLGISAFNFWAGAMSVAFPTLSRPICITR